MQDGIIEKPHRESTSRWVNNGLPRKGWVLVDVVDNFNLNDTCDWCGTNIRYAHYIFHKEQNLESKCGCHCAEKLTEDYVNPRIREKTLRKRAGKAKTWISSPKWKKTPNGNWQRRDDLLWVLAYANSGGWKLKIGNEWGELVYSTLNEAKLSAFRILEQMKNAPKLSDEEFLKNLGEQSAASFDYQSIIKFKESL